ncbi:MAG: sigma-70 family RNA polymerase sigma factor [Phycisphaerae bacterium]
MLKSVWRDSLVQSEQRKGKPPTAEALTDDQARLVDENLGLVGVHLRRNVSSLTRPRRDREWEDLFQEGCLGLIDAARRYRADRGIPFSAFALPRIHNAVTKALRTKFTTVYMPEQRPARSRGPGADRHDPRRGGAVESSSDRVPESRHRPTVRSLSDEAESDLVAPPRCDHRRHAPAGTVGGRLREKYESAVRAAADEVGAKSSTRRDRHELVRILTNERFLIPHTEARRPLRQIARDTRSSYARVAQCERRLSDRVRRALETDPEFRELRRQMRTDPQGGELPIDATVEHALLAASADEFVRRFRLGDGPTRAGILHSVLTASNTDIEHIVRSRFVRLPRSARDRLLAEAESCMTPSAAL